MNEHAKWIADSLGKPVGEFGQKVARILGETFSGIYHLDSKSLKEVDWADDMCIDFKLRWCELATFDTCRLTFLVVLAHDECVRVSITAHHRNILLLRFHPRKGREGWMFERHATMEEAIELVRRVTRKEAER